jgi:hypothetical protein
MAIATQDQMKFVVRELAWGGTPSEVVKEFAREHKGFKCELADVLACLPRYLAPGWRAYFDEQFELYLAAPLADRRVRLAEVNRLYFRERERGAKCEHYIELAEKIDSGFFSKAGKAKPAVLPGTAEPVATITRTIVYPVAPPAPEPA